MFDHLVQELRGLIRHGYHDAKTAHSEIFSDRKDISIVIGYLSIANSYMNSAKAVYICNADELSRQEFDEFFHEFRSFSDEVMTNIRTNHSQQWSDIHFLRLSQAYELVASLLGIVK